MISLGGGVSISGAFVAGNIPIFTAGGQLVDSGAAPVASTQPLDFSGNGASGISGVKVTGAWATGFGTTLTKPQFLVEVAGTTSTSWSNAGTAIGINAPPSFTGNLIDFKVNNTSVVAYSANLTTFYAANSNGWGVILRFNGAYARSDAGFGWASSTSADGTIDAIITRKGAANPRLGSADAASPIAQTLSTQGSRAGTDSNVGGANLTLVSGLGTGTGALSTLSLQSPVAVASGSGAQTATTGLTIIGGAAKKVSYAVSALPSASAVGAGAEVFVTDSNATLAAGLGNTVAGGGANKVPVYSDGTNWIIG